MKVSTVTQPEVAQVLWAVTRADLVEPGAFVVWGGIFYGLCVFNTTYVDLDGDDCRHLGLLNRDKLQHMFLHPSSITKVL